MSTISSVGQFIRGFAEAEKKKSKATQQGWYPFVTISRQAGAGGHALAEVLTKKIEEHGSDPLFSNWQTLDHELCQQVADDPKLTVSLGDLLEERYLSSIEDYFLQAIAGESPQILVHRAVFKIIRSVAAVGKAVIVGRGGNFITRGYPRAIHIRLVAPLEDRIFSTAKRLSITEEEAKVRIGEIDRDRAKLIKNYFKADINDPMGYDAVWNTGSCSIEFIAAAIIEMIKRKAEVEIDEEELS